MIWYTLIGNAVDPLLPEAVAQLARLAKQFY